MEFEFENGKLINLKILKVKGKMPLPESKLKEVQLFATEYHTEIIEKWNDFFILRKTVKNKKITRRIK